jgi:lysyl-tRNA synthetase class 1
MEEKSLFWADQIAEEIASRKKFHYLEKPVPKFAKFIVKTSASLSGVLHIGRLSDTIRGESVFRALKEAGYRSELIWVAEDMDPLRKIPEGVPKDYWKYIGTPVTSVPDPWGCHKSYAEHHVSAYVKVIDEFVSTRMPKYSMRKEYKSGIFNPYIKKLLENREPIKAILNRYRKNPLPKTWSPWQPICENCGKIMTPAVQKFEDGKVYYECKDYRFEKHTAKGCGHKGVNDPLKGEGKLVWKSEFAAQWARWNVSSEGMGKEYQVPGSAFWTNGEIAERILGFPMPIPIFYEHLLIDGEKMSASKGNVIYPADWLKVAPPGLLRFLYNKKLMKTRSFSWSSLPVLYEDYDMHERVYFGGKGVGNEKEREHMKRLYGISQISIPRKMPVQIPFDFAAMVSQVFPDEKISGAIEVFQSSGHIKGKLSKADTDSIRKRLSYARNWVQLRAPEQYRIKLMEKTPEVRLSLGQKKAIQELASLLERKRFKQEELHSLFWEIASKSGIKPQEFFAGVYSVLLGKDSGPKLAPFILAVGQKKISNLLKQVK